MKTRIENYSGVINHCDERWLKTTLNQCLKTADFAILDFIDYQFPNYGYTAIWLLGESHLALHTFPENNNCYIELSSCVPKKGDIFWQALAKLVNIGREQYKVIGD